VCANTEPRHPISRDVAKHADFNLKESGHQAISEFPLHLSSAATGFAGEAVAVGVNIKKGGTDPELKPASEYPSWVAQLATPQETRFDLRKKVAAKGQNNVTFAEVRLDSLETTLHFCTPPCATCTIFADVGPPADPSCLEVWF